MPHITNIPCVWEEADKLQKMGCHSLFRTVEVHQQIQPTENGLAPCPGEKENTKAKMSFLAEFGWIMIPYRNRCPFFSFLWDFLAIGIEEVESLRGAPSAVGEYPEILIMDHTNAIHS